MGQENAEVWSTELDVEVEFGTRRLSIVPLPDGARVVLDTTGGGHYGVLLLGQLTPTDPDDQNPHPPVYRAHDPQGTEVGKGNMFELLGPLFSNHPARHTILSHGVYQRETGL